MPPGPARPGLLPMAEAAEAAEVEAEVAMEPATAAETGATEPGMAAVAALARILVVTVGQTVVVTEATVVAMAMAVMERVTAGMAEKVTATAMTAMIHPVTRVTIHTATPAAMVCSARLPVFSVPCLVVMPRATNRPRFLPSTSAGPG